MIEFLGKRSLLSSCVNLTTPGFVLFLLGIVKHDMNFFYTYFFSEFRCILINVAVVTVATSRHEGNTGACDSIQLSIKKQSTHLEKRRENNLNCIFLVRP